MDSTQDEIINELLSGQNIFLTGSGGTGKSYLIKYIFDILKSRGQKIYKTGSTGVASENIGGVTINSWAGVQLGDKSANYYHLKLSESKRKQWIEANFLIIDEISMVGAKLFQLISDLGMIIKRNRKPFGGIGILICGDVCQLPPVNDDYFFKSKAYQDLKFKTVRLTHPWRFQKDIDFFHLLSRVRIGKQTEDDIKLLQNRVSVYNKEMKNKIFEEGDIKPTQMFSKKVDVNNINLQELKNLKEVEHHYQSDDNLIKKDGSNATIKSFQETIENSVPSLLKLKVGAQVMLTWNIDVENGLCNGSRGVVLECLDNRILVKFKNGEHFISPNVWKIETDDEIFTRMQFPLILAWATTIHKSQSATLDYVIIDIGSNIFCDNMAYVALSRCRSLDSIYIIKFDPSKIKCDQTAYEFDISC